MPSAPPPIHRSHPAILAIAHATYRQLLRDPALLLVAAAALLLIATAPIYAVFHFDESAKVMIDTGLSTVLLAGLLIALLGPLRTLAYELEDRTALTLLSKPVGRLSLVAGKYLGVVAAAFAVLLPLTLAVLYVVRITEALEEVEAAHASMPLTGHPPPSLNAFGYLAAAAVGLTALAGVLARRRRPLVIYLVLVACAAAGPLLIGPLPAWRWSLLGAAVLISLEVAIIAAVGTAAAIRLGAVGALGATFGIIILGHLRALAGPKFLEGGYFGAFAGVIPGLEALDALGAVAAGAPLPALYVATAMLYATMYIGAALLVGAALVQAREVA